MSKKESRTEITNPPAKNSQAAPTYNSQVVWRNIQPSSYDVQQLESGDYDPLVLVQTLLDDLPLSNKVTGKYDRQSSRWNAMLFRPIGDGGEQLEALSVRGRTAFDALILLAYVHVVKFEGEWAGGDGDAASRFG